MCGIFGFIGSRDAAYSVASIKRIFDSLLLLSESRGKEASGVAVRTRDSIKVYKQPRMASQLIKSKIYKRIFYELENNKEDGQNDVGPVVILGHSRLVTDGLQELNWNNQPVSKDKIVGIHNGIVVNHDDLWEKHPELKREYEVDTEILLSLFQMHFESTGCFSLATQRTFASIKGSASIALLPNYSASIIFATNTGSLYTCTDKPLTALIFASERYVLKKMIDDLSLGEIFDRNSITQLSSGEGYELSIYDCQGSRFSLENQNASTVAKKLEIGIEIIDVSETIDRPNMPALSSKGRKLKKEVRELMHRNWEYIYKGDHLRRCSRCILPESMTYIDFDERGVCNYCRNYERVEILGQDALEKILKQHRSNSNRQDCIVSVSGGRDSCHALHYIKTKLDMNPVAFTYDWGVVTDLARRNLARMCGKLGVEHIVVSADIGKKRRNIHKNIRAWLKRPELGMIPLLMAGDKQMLYYVDRLMKQTDIQLAVYAIGNGLEHSPFKIGFAGVLLENFKPHPWISWKDKITYLSYYAKQYALNPAYINVSLVDTFWAFCCNFIINYDNLQFYRYIPWNENEVNSTLINEYEWETAPDTTTTWRIGDGTASFYNYVYMTVAGLTEHDTFRSNQIREGSLTRKEALAMIPEDNWPRYEGIEWYANTIGFDCNEAINVVNEMPKRHPY